MLEKSRSKLVLKTETLRALDATDLGDVNGGTSPAWGVAARLTPPIGRTALQYGKSAIKWGAQMASWQYCVDAVTQTLAKKK